MTAERERLPKWLGRISGRIGRRWRVQSEGKPTETGARPGRRVQMLPVDWHAVLAVLPDPALLLDRNSIILDFNDKAAELFSQLAGGIQISAVSRNPDLLEGIGLMRDGGDQITVALHERVPLERTMMATLSRLPAEARDIAGPELLITIRDLTEASRIERTRADFVANASHELRTPLASIIGFIETLQGAAKNDLQVRDKFLTVMAMQAQRMKRLVDDLMSLTNVEMHAHVMPRDDIDINEVIDHVRESLEPLAQAERITLTLKLLDQPASVQGDWDELVQVFQNLIHNGIRYGRPGGSVTVHVEQALTGRTPKHKGGRFFRVHVIDDGQGIASQHLPRLTERFYRVDVAASRKKEGTGLGLAIAKHVINRHRGELEIKSKLGQGSTFTVTLPEVAAHLPAARPGPAASTLMTKSKNTF